MKSVLFFLKFSFFFFFFLMQFFLVHLKFSTVLTIKSNLY